MPIEINSGGVVCSRCGKAYGRRKGYFLVNNGSRYKGVGYMSVCKECTIALYADYLNKCDGDQRLAMRQVCRKLDLYWSDKIYEGVEKKNVGNSIVVGYITRMTTSNYAGKSYDDTLVSEGTMWSFDEEFSERQQRIKQDAEPDNDEQDLSDLSEEVIAFWGVGYTPEMYTALEQRRQYWMSRLSGDTELDIGTEAIIRQICSLELDINRDRAAGRAVDKSINALNTLLGSASLKPAQKKGDGDSSLYNTPMGVWIDRFEYKKPIPNDESDADKDYLVKYILAWFGGHLSKMFGIQNANTKLYDEEVAKYRVYRPDFDDDTDDDELMYNVLADVEEPDDTSSFEEDPGDQDDTD